MHPLPAPPARRGERGSLLIGAVVMVTILLIGSAVAVQQWSTVIRRDREEELIFRGRQIAMALAMYRKDNGTFPTDYKQITEMGGPGGGRYYLRRPYKDPVNNNADWGLVYLSPQGVPVNSSGQPIGTGSTGTGAGTGKGGSSEDDPFGDEEDDEEEDDDFGFGDPGQPGQQQGSTGVNNQQAGTTGEVAGLPIIGVHSKSTETAMGPARWRNIEKYSEWTFTVQDLDSAFTLAPAVGPIQPGNPGGGGGIGQPGQPGQPGGPGMPGTPGQIINPQGGGGQSIQPH